ncbi:MAG: WecB/TagA/CpsF family glycosyltransferase [Candidatus Uhrbacteria bacterium]|nr:WecB/TagA/CpsF family glycosyltransferase [Candidatus Uhrbacteria bacterium]
MTDNVHAVWGVPLHDLTDDELRARLADFLRGERAHIVVTPNPEFVMTARKNEDYRILLANADMSVPDGIGLRFAVAALSQDRLRHRHSGVDVVEVLAELANATSSSFVFLGGMHPFLERARQYFATQYPGILCTAINPGFIPDVASDDLVSQNVIHQLLVSDAKIIAVALGRGRGAGLGKQERYMDELARKFPSARIIIGVGGAVDYFGSAVSRAPRFWRQYGMEWLWRLGAEPWRARRIANAIFVFPILVAWDTLRSGQFISACRRVFQEILLLFRKV